MGKGKLYVKRSRMLVVSLRDENNEFWSHLGCSYDDKPLSKIPLFVHF